MEITIKKISKIINEQGFISFFLKTHIFIKKNFFGVSKKFIYEYDLNNDYPEIRSNIKFSIKEAKEKDIDSMDEQHYDYDAVRKKYSKDRLKKGDKCFLTIHKGKIIGYVWMMKDYMELSDYNLIPISKNKVYFYKAFLLNEFRGKRIRNVADIIIYNMLKKAGKKHVILAIYTDNKPAMKAVERFGFKKIGYIKMLRFFGLKYDYIEKNQLIYLQN